jgi:hypothetical protein
MKIASWLENLKRSVQYEGLVSGTARQENIE